MEYVSGGDKYGKLPGLATVPEHMHIKRRTVSHTSVTADSQWCPRGPCVVSCAVCAPARACFFCLILLNTHLACLSHLLRSPRRAKVQGHKKMCTKARAQTHSNESASITDQTRRRCPLPSDAPLPFPRCPLFSPAGAHRGRIKPLAPPQTSLSSATALLSPRLAPWLRRAGNTH